MHLNSYMTIDGLIGGYDLTDWSLIDYFDAERKVPTRRSRLGRCNRGR